MSTLRKLRGWFRLRSGFCPACNSDSPEFWDCRVCDKYDNGRRNDNPYPPAKWRKELWWFRFCNQEEPK